MPTPTRQVRFAIAALLLFILAVGSSLGGDYSKPKRVLILDSFGPSPNTAGAAAFRTTLERELGQPVDIHHVTLDPARFAEPVHEVQLVEFLKARYQGKVDLVVPMLLPATEFVTRHRDLFDGTPIVIAGISLRRMPPEFKTLPAAYVAARANATSFVEDILRLLPDTRQIVMVFGASKFDQASSTLARAEYPKFAPHVEFVWLEGLSMEDLERRVAVLSAGSVVLLGNFVVDGTGLAIDKDEVVRRLHTAAKVPFFGFFESFFGRGIVGGRLYPDVTLGVEGARIAIRILKGEALSKIEPVVIDHTAQTYDWRELQRFGIPEERLPPDSEILYRRETLWQAYRWHAAGAITLLLLQAALITGLVLQRTRQHQAEAERRRAEMELQHTRAELMHMTRVSSLGELSGSLAHELNQPLTAILSNVQAAQRFMTSGSPADLEDVREILADIAQDDKRASEVIRRMRSMVKKGSPDVVTLDLESTVNEVMLLLHNDAVLRDVSVSLEAEPGLPAVLGDRIQLQQVVMNLLLNAFDAMKELHGSDRVVNLSVGYADSRMLKVTVTDVGHGLSEEALERVFEAFYTTKSHGLGMGLCISRSIVEAHQGRIWAENNPSRGATFGFTIPLASG